MGWFRQIRSWRSHQPNDNDIHDDDDDANGIDDEEEETQTTSYQLHQQQADDDDDYYMDESLIEITDETIEYRRYNNTNDGNNNNDDELPTLCVANTTSSSTTTTSSSNNIKNSNSNTNRMNHGVLLNRYTTSRSSRSDRSVTTTTKTAAAAATSSTIIHLAPTTNNESSSAATSMIGGGGGVPSTTIRPTTIGSRRYGNNNKSSVQSVSSSSLYATIQDVPQLVHALQTSPTITCDQASHTLRRLFALSEYTSTTMKGGGDHTTTTTSTVTANNNAPVTKLESLEETRKQMILDSSLLVPALFRFLIRCYVEDDSSSSTHHPSSSPPSRRHNNNNKTSSNRAVSMLHPASMYLTLLVLNNLCIPNDNKRYIAFQCHGIDIICHLLCYDPSCRMLAIVLVNLSFGTNAQFQQDLLFESTPSTTTNNNNKRKDTDLLSSLAYALRIASLTRDEYNVRQRLFAKEANEILSWDSRYNTLAVNATCRDQQLQALLVFDQQQQYTSSTKSWPTHSEQLFPDTARWCICALHHLTRPLLQYNHHQQYQPYQYMAVVETTNPPLTTAAPKLSAALALTRTNIVQHLLCCIRIGATTSVDSLSTDNTPNGSRTQFSAAALTCHTATTLLQQNASSDINVPLLFNDPSTWVKETSQDAALFVIMNISIDPLGRKYLLGHDIDTVHLLATIADSYRPATKTNLDRSHVSTGIAKTASSGTNVELVSDAIKVQQFQCIKARMTLSYLVGSQGHYGQDKNRVGKWVNDYIRKGKVLSMKYPFEVEQLVDMLAHTLCHRTKVGPGGFSGTTFRLKYIVWSIRCLLTQPDNQEMFAGNGMEVLNALLIKILALRAVQNVSYIDTETVEYACFSLYLLSHYGFHICFLPTSLGKDYDVRHIVTKVLIAIQSINDTTLATHHAIRQILYRLRYLLCIDTAASINATTRYTKWRFAQRNDNYILDQDLLVTIRNMLISDRVRSGAQPHSDIFNRPIISARRRSRTMHRNGEEADDDDNTGDQSPTTAAETTTSNNNNSTSISRTYYNSAIHAVYDLSFQSTKVRHLNETTIDDIAIANNIVNCANGKTSIESYGYTWTWDDDDGNETVNGTERHDSPLQGRGAVRTKATNSNHPIWSFFSQHENCCVGGGSNNNNNDAISLNS